MEHKMIAGRPVIDPRTREGRKALGFMAYRTRQLIDLLGLSVELVGRPHYSKAELCLMCAERGLKRPMV